MVVLDPDNKRDHAFEAWIRLIQNECETCTYIIYIYIYVCVCVKFLVGNTLVLIGVSVQAAHCA